MATEHEDAANEVQNRNIDDGTEIEPHEDERMPTWMKLKMKMRMRMKMIALNNP